VVATPHARNSVAADMRWVKSDFFMGNRLIEFYLLRPRRQGGVVGYKTA